MERIMYRQISNTKRTASYHKGFVTICCDDGWETILDCRFSATQTEADTFFTNGWEAYDPNAELKAKGFIFINGTYQKPAT